MCLGDHACQHFGNAGRIAHLFLIGDHVFEQFHLFDFLKAPLPNGLVGRLRCDQQQWRMVPVSRFDGCDKVGDAGAVLRDHHRHLAGGARVPIGHHAGRAFVGTIPEVNASFRETGPKSASWLIR